MLLHGADSRNGPPLPEEMSRFVGREIVRIQLRGQQPVFMGRLATRSQTACSPFRARLTP
jgi:hypothetical protein